jgi:hypothetical protein
MTKIGWLVTGAIALGTVVFIKGGCLNQVTKAPDQRLASHFKEMCGIARDGSKNAVRGAKKLGVYLVRNGGDMLDDFGSTLAAIERIADDDKHDERAQLARQRWNAVSCPHDWQRFDDAINESPEAQELIQHAADRLGRTFEIIFSGAGAPNLLGGFDRVLSRRLNLELPARGLATKPRGPAQTDVAKP